MSREGKELVERLESAVKQIGRGPNLSAFGQVVEDCALAHMDYFAAVGMGAAMVIDVIAAKTGETETEVAARLRPARQCDCPAPGCAGREGAAKAEAAYRVHLLEDLTPEFRAAVKDTP